MAGSKNDRKRPAESSTKPTGETTKRIKKDAKKTTTPTPKSTSTAAPSTPAAPVVKSTLKAKEETAFPRGGGNGLTPLEYKEISNEAVKDVLFEAKTGKAVENGEEVKSKGKKTVHKDKKKQKKGSKETEKENEGPKVEGLSFKVSRLYHGGIVLDLGLELTFATAFGTRSPRFGMHLSNQPDRHCPLVTQQLDRLRTTHLDIRQVQREAQKDA